MRPLLLCVPLVVCGGVVCSGVGCSGEPPPKPVVAPPATATPAVEATAVARAVPVPATPIADGYRKVANKIIEAALANGGAWKKLAHMTDRIGHRLTGSKALAQAIDWAAATMKADGHENVRKEKAMVPHWVRGQEKVELVAPVKRKLHVLTLGLSVGTAGKTLSADVIAIASKKELATRSSAVKGKIVLFTKAMPPFHPEQGPKYGETVVFRNTGAALAVKHGAVAVLVRSVTAHSLRSPHTGMTMYDKGGKKIPAVAVSTEDSELISRLLKAGETVKVSLKLGAKSLPDVESHNVVGELVGRDQPQQVVVIGGHIDSWDTGTGAHDDAAGCVVMMEALTVLRKLGLKPRRTIRTVLWTSEEVGLYGAKAYAQTHLADMPNHVAGIESDSGVFDFRGFRIKGTDQALAQGRDIVTLLAPLVPNGRPMVKAGFAGADLIPMERHGVQTLGVRYDISKYFDYHHSHADTLDKVDPAHVRKAVAAAATMAYVLADMPDRFGR